MCSPSDSKPASSSEGLLSNNKVLITAIAFCGAVTIASVASLAAVASKAADSGTSAAGFSSAKDATIVVNTGDMLYATGKPPAGENPCSGKKPELPNYDCVIGAIVDVKPQAGGNVTKGYKGGMQVDHVPITTPYWKNEMCPVNVHWHLGTEHYSAGEYDEFGSGPVQNNYGLGDRRLAETEARKGYQCRYYDLDDNKFNTPYVWKHCVGMRIGETYEVHWPHSAAGMCGTPNQYQTPFYDGVFCVDGVLTDTAAQIGVQAQIFTIVNDEDYYYPDLFRGMIVDGEMGQDIAMYTGSTTGTSRDNEVCSQYSPITWQVDRKCHMISASSFDKMCADMKAQRDDMTDDLYAHGSRTLVSDELTANNQANRKLRASA